MGMIRSMILRFYKRAKRKLKSVKKVRVSIKLHNILLIIIILKLYELSIV
jgi:hypothetical protein